MHCTNKHRSLHDLYTMPLVSTPKGILRLPSINHSLLEQSTALWILLIEKKNIRISSKTCDFLQFYHNLVLLGNCFATKDGFLADLNYMLHILQLYFYYISCCRSISSSLGTQSKLNLKFINLLPFLGYHITMYSFEKWH